MNIQLTHFLMSKQLTDHVGSKTADLPVEERTAKSPDETAGSLVDQQTAELTDLVGSKHLILNHL
jgi:hypothetical protein